MARGLGQQFMESKSTAIHSLTQKVVTESIDSLGWEGWVSVRALQNKLMTDRSET